ncbi:hypothetical protein D3C71_69880 [compost metagenome]
MSQEQIKSIIPVDKIYDDALSPAMKQIGKALENLAKSSRFILAPIDYIAHQHDRWERYLQKVTDKVKNEDLIEGHPQIVIPTLEGLNLNYENTLLTELFINLLANSIDRTKQDLAHPAFPNIIKQLSHDEAVILFLLKKRSYKFNLRSDLNVEGTMVINEVTTLEEFPLDTLQFPEHLPIYMNHLDSLNIAGAFVNNKEYIYDKNNKPTGINSYNERRIIDFGELFVTSCVPDNFENL